MHFSSQVPGPSNRGFKLITKKIKVTKSEHVVLEGITRVTFVQAILSAS
jgi:hypothetical protein